jgi:hypothetical protein
VATLDRIEPSYKPWTPSAAGNFGIAVEDDDYVGRHRKPSGRRLSLTRLFYSARHRKPGGH